jgi:hypothetical protein
MTVPQHEWLWSVTDEYAHHERRYTASELYSKLNKAGFEVLRSTSFVTTLLPLMMVSRMFQKRTKQENFNPSAELSLHPVLNGVLSFFLNLEVFLIKIGLSFPVGGSRLVIASKIMKEDTNE